DLELGDRAFDPAGRLRRRGPGRPHGVLAAWPPCDGPPRRAQASGIPLHVGGQLRHLDPVRLLVTGAAGMLGHDVMRAGERSGHELVLLDLPEIDITDAVAVEALLDRLLGEPGALGAIVNCAAWTDVDGAESKRELAHAVN